MISSTLTIPVAFVLLAAVAIWILLGSNGWWWLKTTLCSITIYFCIVIWYSMGSYLGWPAEEQLPLKFQVHWATVTEPESENQGGVYLWVTEITNDKPNDWITWMRYRPPEKQPRSFRTPYSKDMHRNALRLQAAIKQGIPMMGTRSGKIQAAGKGKGKAGYGKGVPGEGDGTGGKGFGSLSRSDALYFEPLPLPKFPPKFLEPDAVDMRDLKKIEVESQPELPKVNLPPPSPPERPR